MTNHPTQGLQDMTINLSTYSAEALAELQTRIEEEKTKREREEPFEIIVRPNPNGGADRIIIASSTVNVFNNLELRLTAEAKLRAAGGGEWSQHRGYLLAKNIGSLSNTVTDFSTTPVQGVVFFESVEQALSAYATLTPDEQAAIFGFGEG